MPGGKWGTDSKGRAAGRGCKKQDRPRVDAPLKHPRDTGRRRGHTCARRWRKWWSDVSQGQTPSGKEEQDSYWPCSWGPGGAGQGPRTCPKGRVEGTCGPNGIAGRSPGWGHSGLGTAAPVGSLAGRDPAGVAGAERKMLTVPPGSHDKTW